MRLVHHIPAAVLLTSLGLLATPQAHAAQSYDSCTGFIDSLPATLTQQGTWCLRKDLNTAIASGAAITVATNNVTIDCNDFKLGGLPAGSDTATIGIRALNRLNVTVRRCSIRGFASGVALTGEEASGHVVEDNRFANNTMTGIRLDGVGSVARRNQILDTGGSTLVRGRAVGIEMVYNTDAIDNTVETVMPATEGGNATAYGIITNINFQGSISGNRVRGLVSAGTGAAHGIINDTSTRVKVHDNDVTGNTTGTGIGCSDPRGLVQGNRISAFATPIDGCTDAGGNAIGM